MQLTGNGYSELSQQMASGSGPGEWGSRMLLSSLPAHRAVDYDWLAAAAVVDT